MCKHWTFHKRSELSAQCAAHRSDCQLPVYKTSLPWLRQNKLHKQKSMNMLHDVLLDLLLWNLFVVVYFVQHNPKCWSSVYRGIKITHGADRTVEWPHYISFWPRWDHICSEKVCRFFPYLILHIAYSKWNSFHELQCTHTHTRTGPHAQTHTHPHTDQAASLKSKMRISGLLNSGSCISEGTSSHRKSLSSSYTSRKTQRISKSLKRKPLQSLLH